MSLILYINGQQADLEPGTVIAQTRQVNDLNSLENRQAGYTNKFSLPKTAQNLRIMDFLTLTGNESNIPYQKNECSLYSASGECFVYKGRAVITDAGDSFDAVIYDGIIDLYKDIEGLTLSYLDLGELNHKKNMEAVVASWTNLTLPYRYILADYNGKPGNVNTNPPNPSIDYLVPSVNVAWLWDKVFEKFSTAYTGNVFQTQNFKNLWMTFPKGLDAESSSTEVFASADFVNSNVPEHYNNPFADQYWRTLLLKYQSFTTQDTTFIEPDVNPYSIKVKQGGTYRLKLSGSIKSNVNMRIQVIVNHNYSTNAALDNVLPYATLNLNQPHHESFDLETTFNLNESDRLSIILRHKNGTQDAIRFADQSDKWEGLELSLTAISLGDADFTTAFEDFSIRDFLTEVVHRFGLTFYKDKYQKSYTFLTLQEIVQNTDIEDWSRKFIKKNSENYIYGSYAQQNWFRYAYNDKEGAYHDSYIGIDNVNLPESKEVLKSKIYSPEKLLTRYLKRQGNVYKLWEKELEEGEDGQPDTIKYKPLDKRYYFLRATVYNAPVVLKSGETNQSYPIQPAWVESFYKLPFADVVEEYYMPLSRILDKARIVTAALWLTDEDLLNLRFDRLYYIEQLASYFILNKVNNYIPGKATTCEFVRVLYGAVKGEAKVITAVSVSSSKKFGQYTHTLTYSANYPLGNVVIQAGYPQNGEWVWNDITGANLITGINPAVFKYGFYDGEPQEVHFRVTDTTFDISGNILTTTLT